MKTHFSLALAFAFSLSLAADLAADETVLFGSKSPDSSTACRSSTSTWTNGPRRGKTLTERRTNLRSGRIGMQNHGQVASFKDIVVKPL